MLESGHPNASPNNMAPALQPLYALWLDVQHARVMAQLALVAIAVAAGALSGYLVARRDTRGSDRIPRLGRKALRALAFPLVALAVLLVGHAALHPSHGRGIVAMAIALLTALAILRFSLLLLREVFASSPLLHTLTHAVAWLVWTGFALHVTGLAPTVLAALEAAHFSVGKQRISVLLVLQAALSVVTAVLIALWLGRYVEARLMAAESVQVSLRVMLTKLAKALFVLLAVLIALPAVGIDITALSVFGGMLGVGIGFGLQKIASNYVSGFIILMDRSVSIGDIVTIEQHTGRVTKMTARYVVVRNPAGTETLIPNERLIGEALINHTYSDRRVHVQVPVQVGYDTNMDEAVRVLEDIAGGHRRVLAEPPPRVRVQELGDSGIHLELGVWIDDPEDGIGNVRSDLYFEILRRFAAAGIEIPYPQRELRMRPPGGGAPAKTPYATKT